MATHAIIVAGGQGTRAGGAVPKQRQLLCGKPVYQWSIQAFAAHASIEQVVLVVPEMDAESYTGELEGSKTVVATGGQTRTQSVLNGLRSLDAQSDDIVLIHDAARPGLKNSAISTLIDALETSDAAAPALSVADALKRKRADQLETVDRANIYRVQTPQAFRYRDIMDALNEANTDLVDDLAAIERRGGKVTLVPGHERLSKITYPGDLERMEQMIAPAVMMPRIGSGFDVHAFGPGESVTLCGVEIEHSQSLAGHSDADVVWHALTDAILGALALGDIGDHFPPSDPQWKGAPSRVFLEHAVNLAAERGYEISNCDLTVICEAPKIKPHRETMRIKTAEVLGAVVETVSVKATTTEQLGFTGRREGIAAQAICMLGPIQTLLES